VAFVLPCVRRGHLLLMNVRRKAWRNTNKGKGLMQYQQTQKLNFLCKQLCQLNRRYLVQSKQIRSFYPFPFAVVVVMSQKKLCSYADTSL